MWAWRRCPQAREAGGTPTISLRGRHFLSLLPERQAPCPPWRWLRATDTPTPPTVLLAAALRAQHQGQRPALGEGCPHSGAKRELGLRPPPVTQHSSPTSQGSPGQTGRNSPMAGSLQERKPSIQPRGKQGQWEPRQSPAALGTSFNSWGTFWVQAATSTIHKDSRQHRRVQQSPRLLHSPSTPPAGLSPG